jgi:methyl-accepting chemotaxis protein
VARIEQTIGEVNAIATSVAAAIEEQGAATAEIARNVASTAAAANEMTERTGEVSTEAGQTGQRAAEVRANAAALNTDMDELRHTVIRVVRTSTGEVNRRQHQRYATDLACRVAFAGGAARGMYLADVCAGGAAIRGAPAMSAGARGTVDVERIGMVLPFVVRSADASTMHVAFEVDAATTARLSGLLERMALAKAA